jgi:5-methylcytosine-specific restriction enzyme A
MPDEQKHRNPSWTRDEVILGLDTYLEHRSSGLSQAHPAILELSRMLNALAERLHRKMGLDFRNPNGVYMKMGNFMHLDPSYQGVGLSAVSSMEREVWNEYANRPLELHVLANSIRHALIEAAEELLNTGAEPEEHDFPEGALKYRQHVTRERNKELVSRAKERALNKNGRLKCEACGFDFEAVYGPPRAVG